MSEELNSVKLLLEEVKKQLDRIDSKESKSNFEIIVNKCNNCDTIDKDRLLLAFKYNKKKLVEGYIHCLYNNDNIDTEEFDNLMDAL